MNNHAEKEIQIVFTECGVLPENVNESSLNICSTHFSHIVERNIKRNRRIYMYQSTPRSKIYVLPE
jgi:hypothetical protein